jgi:hypothetical protein
MWCERKTALRSDNMAKKPTAAKGKKMTATTEEAALKQVRLELTPDVQQDFRVEAAKEGISMAAMAKRLVEEWVAKRKAGGK